MNKILNERGVGGNQFHSIAIISDIEETNNKIIIFMNNVTTSNGNQDVLPKDKDRAYLCLIDELVEVGEPRNEEVNINE